MRSVFAFVAFLLMLVGGAVGAFYLSVFAGGATALVGGFLIWAVFVAPIFGIRPWAD
jgi:hypothetical protein